MNNASAILFTHWRTSAETEVGQKDWRKLHLLLFTKTQLLQRPITDRIQRRHPLAIFQTCDQLGRCSKSTSDAKAGSKSPKVDPSPPNNAVTILQAMLRNEYTILFGSYTRLRRPGLCRTFERGIRKSISFLSLRKSIPITAPVSTLPTECYPLYKQFTYKHHDALATDDCLGSCSPFLRAKPTLCPSNSASIQRLFDVFRVLCALHELSVMEHTTHSCLGTATAPNNWRKAGCSSFSARKQTRALAQQQHPATGARPGAQASVLGNMRTPSQRFPSTVSCSTQSTTGAVVPRFDPLICQPSIYSCLT